MNINDLTEDQLNTLAALGQGWEYGYTSTPSYKMENNEHITVSDYDPCNNGSQAMELVVEYLIDMTWIDRDIVHAHIGNFVSTGEPLPSIVRAFVASKYGVEIDYEKIVGGE